MAEARPRPRMDEARVDAVLDRLISLGLAEQQGADVRPTRRWSAKLQAAAEKLNLIHASTGVQLEGNPLVVAAAQALANENLDIPDADFDEHVRVLVLLELARMPPEKRVQHGFGDVLFPGERAPRAGSSVEF